MDSRLIRTDIFKSSVMFGLAEKYPTDASRAQRVFLSLILTADDWGNGRYIPQAIILEAFGSAPEDLKVVTACDLEKWIAEIVRQNALELYEVNEQRYYHLTGWDRYQEMRYRKKNTIPTPEGYNPPEKYAETFIDFRNLPKISGNLTPKVKRKEEKKEEERKDLSAKSADGIKTPAAKGNGKPSKPKGNTIPIEDRKATTDNQRLVQQWYRQHLKYEGVRWSGDPARMGGQAKVLLRDHEYADLIAAMNYLFDFKPHEDYRPHTWDFYVRKISTLLVESLQHGYFPDPKLKLERTNHA